MADVTRIIGIDFGTSTSVVCVKRYQDGKTLGGAFLSASVTFGNGQGDTRAHTIVRRNGDGTYTCGREAEDETPGAEIFREFKMDLENPDEGKRAQARALTEEFFKYLYRWYDHQRSNLGEAGDREKTIVSYPAKWSEDTRQFMAEAAKKAGFPDVRVMDEPSAALYATLTQNMNDVSAKGLLRAGEPGYMLLIDMGAGTTDLAVCRYTVEPGADGVIRAEQIRNEIVSTWPESASAPTFGGREVDRILEGYLTEYIITCGLPDAMARQLVCGTAAVKPWKESVVSARLNEGNTVDTCGFLSGYMMLLPQKQPFPAIDRGKFQELLAEKLEDFKSLVAGCLDKACALEPAIRENGIDLVVLTGGHSAWYFTEELLNGAMPGVSHPALKRAQAEKARVMRLSNPQETVALGLVYSMLPMKVERETAPERKKAVAEPADGLNEVVEKKADQTGEQTDDPIVSIAIEFFDEWVIEANTEDAWRDITATRPSREQICFDWQGPNNSFSMTARKEGLFYEGARAKQGFTQPWDEIRWLNEVLHAYAEFNWYIGTHMKKLDALLKPIYTQWIAAASEPLYQEALRFIDDWMGIDFAPEWKPYSPERGVILWEEGYDGQKCNLTVTIKPEGINIKHDSDETVLWNEFKMGDLRDHYDNYSGLYLDDRLLSKKMSPHGQTALMAFLMALHMRLWGNPLWRPTGPEKAGAVGVRHLPDGRKKDIEDFIVQNRKEWDLNFDFSRESVFRSYLCIPNNVQILLAAMYDTAFKMNFGKDGWAITREGIYKRQGFSPDFYSWESFVGPFDYYWSPLGDAWKVVPSGQREEFLDFYLALRTHVRGLMGMD